MNFKWIDDVDAILQYKTMLYSKQNTLFGQLQEHKIAYQLENIKIFKNRTNAKI